MFSDKIGSLKHRFSLLGNYLLLDMLVKATLRSSAK